MDAEQAFVRVENRISQMLTPKVRATLEYLSLFIAITLFCSLVFMHAQYVKQPACSSEFSGFATTEAKLMLIKITSAGLWLHNQSESNRIDVPDLKSAADKIAVSGDKSKAFEPTYLYTIEKGYFLLPESAKSLHNIRSMNVSISAQHSCFGKRWQRLIINKFVGYDTIVVNSLLSSPGQGYLYNYQTKEFYNLSYTQVPMEGLATFGEKFVTKCGILLMSFFVFSTTTMSASFILREAQTRMLKFAVQLRHHALHGLPTLQLILVQVLESLVFVPVMIGILFFLFEFYDDQLLAFMVLALVWLCELFTLISVRTAISTKFFPLFFLLYFMVFHIYFLFYPYGFTYLALLTTAAFTVHIILYFWNRFEVPAFQRFITQIRGSPQNPQDFQITQSTIVARTLHITRLNARDQGSANTDPTSRSDPSMPQNGGVAADPQGQPGNNAERVANPEQVPGQAIPAHNPGFLNSVSSLLSWISEGASSLGLNSIFSLFRGVRDEGQVLAEPPEDDNPEEVFSDAREE